MNSESLAKRKCMGADCENDAGTLQCPTCLKLGMKDSYFCSQDCFKRNWVRLKICLLPCKLYAPSACSARLFEHLELTFHSLHIKPYTKLRVIFSVISYLQKLSLNPIQTPAYTIPFQHSLILVPCDQFILSPNDENYLNR